MSAMRALIQGWDCHAHVFGPYDRFPLAAERSYTPPEAVESQYLALLARLDALRGTRASDPAYLLLTENVRFLLSRL